MQDQDVDGVKGGQPGNWDLVRVDHIKVHCARASNELELRVEDRGPGISPHAFEAFVQGDEHRSTGLGLRLAIVRRLAALHGGSVLLCHGFLVTVLQ